MGPEDDALTHRDPMTAREAANCLGISLATLYSYVSRDLLHPVAFAGPQGGRAKRYRSAEVQRLARHNGGVREPRRVASNALDFGLPILQSSLSLIERARLYYRGHDAVLLAETAGLEEVATLLWDCSDSDFVVRGGAGMARGYPTAPTMSCTRTTPEGLLAAFYRTIADDPGAVRAEVDDPAGVGWALVLAMTAAATGHVAAPNDGPLHEQLRSAWRLPRSAGDALRRALMLCADHELNASSFTARCVASTGAAPVAAVAAALAALTGPRHGGTNARVEAWWPQMELHVGSPQKLREWVMSQPALPGFGHALYPDGDPRALCILQNLPRDERVDRLLEAALECTGRLPNIDFSLVALRRAIGAPEGAAFAIFAISRTVGWLAHAFEQKRSGQLIRPRAEYVGQRPTAPELPVSGRIVKQGASRS